jgi:hypothetical protein
VVYLCMVMGIVQAQYAQWSFQQVLTVPEAGYSYGKGPFALHGRGFRTLISGYKELSPGSVYVHTTDDGVLSADGNFAWSLQAKLVPDDHGSSTPSASPTQLSSGFGSMLASDNKTLIISSPYYTSDKSEQGAVYIFNGTARHWTQLQKILIKDASDNDHLGKQIKLENDRMILSAEGSKSNTGAIYVYERNPHTLMWTDQAKLVASDTGEGSLFGRSISLSGDTALVAALNDDYGLKRSGSAYFFNRTGGLWSQQQKLVSIDAEFSYLPLMVVEKWSGT